MNKQNAAPQSLSPSVYVKSSRSAMIYRRWMWGYLFILPQALFFFVLTLYPIVMSYVYSLYSWSGIGPMNKYVGFGNYTKLFKDPQFWRSMLHTTEYLLGHTIIVIPVAFALAVVLNNSKFKGSGIYRVVYFIPVITTTAIVGVVMRLIFSNTGNGLMNSVLLKTHLISQPIAWLNSSGWAMFLLIIVGSWKYVGVVMIYWLAGLQTISNDLYEAAEIDGADTWKRLYYITLPMLKPIAAVILLLTAVNSMHVFDLALTFTGGGPFFATETMDVYVYNYAFGGLGGMPQLGYASAGGVCLGIFVCCITLALAGLVRVANRNH